MRINVQCDKCNQWTYVSDAELEDSVNKATPAQIKSFINTITKLSGDIDQYVPDFEVNSIEDELKLKAVHTLFTKLSLVQLENLIKTFTK